MIFRMTSSMIPSASVFLFTSSACCAEHTTAVTSRGTPSTYRTVTWLFPSGRSHGSTRFSRASVSRPHIRCANAIGIGINSFVSVQANPNIIPWSPAPCFSGPPPRGSFRMISSRIASEIWSATLSGWPPVTDSEVNRKSFMRRRSCGGNRRKSANYTSESLFREEVFQLFHQNPGDGRRGGVGEQPSHEIPRLVRHRLSKDPLHARDGRRVHAQLVHPQPKEDVRIEGLSRHLPAHGHRDSRDRKSTRL